MINYKKLRKVCSMPINHFSQYGETVRTKDGIYVYKNIGSKVLAVAHLDSVCKPKHFRVRNNIIKSPVLDDRLGAYIILYLLPSLGIHTDILLTEGEESGNSTAQHFKTDKKYNWMFQFDREGTDAVLYGYDGQSKWKDKLEKLWDIDFGIFSDISYLEHLGCKGVNIGCSYYNYHSPKAYMVISELENTIQKFITFYHQNKDKKFKHVEDSYSGYGGYYYGYPYYNERKIYHSSLYIDCLMCGDIFFKEDIGMWYNKHTDTQAYNNQLCPYCYLDYINQKTNDEIVQT